jgi:hypothetical protein
MGGLECDFILYAIAGSIKVLGRGKIQTSFLAVSILSAVSLEAVFFKTIFLGVTVGMIVTVGFYNYG